jgi:acyl-CoA reductase-like NAD-dependent aldehyde dehydrogenase
MGSALEQEVAEVIDVVCPADGRHVGQVPIHSAGDVAAMAADLRAAQPAWQALGARGRGAWMARFRM